MAEKNRPLPYYKWEVQAYRATREVQRMTWQQRGMYRELLDECWVEGGFPNKAAAIAEIIGCTVEELNEAWPTLKQRFVLDETTRVWHNERLDSVRTEADMLRVKRALAGKAGGTAKSASTKGNVAIASKSQAKAGKSHIEDKSREDTPKAPKGAGDDGFEEIFWPSYPRKVGKPIALRAYLKAVKRAGGTAAIMAGLQRHLPYWKAKEREGDADKIPHPSTWLNRDGWNDDVAALPASVADKEIDPLDTREGVEALAAEIGYRAYDDTVPFPTWRSAVLVAAGKIRAPAVGLEELARMAGKRSET